MRIVFDKNVPVGVRAFLARHDVRTFDETGWPRQLENGDLLDKAEGDGFDVVVTADKNIRHQQNLTDRKIALVVLGSNIWPLVRNYEATIASKVNAVTPGSYEFIDMPLPPKDLRSRLARGRLREGEGHAHEEE